MSVWLPRVQPELDPPDHVVPVPPTAIHVGWRRALKIDWRLDAVLVRGTWGTEVCYLPAVVASPLVHFPMDEARVCQEFDRWAKAVAASRRNPLDSTPVPALDDLLLRPLTGPTRRSEPVAATRELWDNRRSILALATELHHTLDADEGEAPELEVLIGDYPFVVVTLPSDKRPWDVNRAHMPPSKADSLDRVRKPSRRGRPRGVKLPHLAAELHALLRDARSLQSARWRELADQGGPLKARWAVQTALDLGRTDPGPEVTEVRRWLDSLELDEDGDRKAAGARALDQYVTNRQYQLRHGRHIRRGLSGVRRIVPYICPDLSVFPRTFKPAVIESREHRDAVLIDWIRSVAFARMMLAVSGKQPGTLTMRSSDGSLDAFLRERGLPFSRQRVTFEPANEDYRGVVAMVPGAQPCEAVSMDITGFGDDAEEPLAEWIGDALPDDFELVSLLDGGPVALDVSQGRDLLLTLDTGPPPAHPAESDPG